MRPRGVSAELVGAGIIPASSSMVASMRLDAVPAAPGLARKFVETQLARATAAQREAADVLTGDLVTSAVLDSGSSVEVLVASLDGRVVLAVCEPSRPRAGSALRGRQSPRSAGTMLMTALADEHGTFQHDPGRTVWAVLHEHGRAAGAAAREEGVARRR